MKQLLLFLFFLSQIPFLSFSQEEKNGAILHNGGPRSFILYIPANYTGETPVPLLFNYHGYTSHANEHMWYADFRAIADTAGFLIVHPEGTLDSDGKTHFNVGWGGSSVDDVGYAGLLLDTLSNRYNIDANRVYSTGMSNGGYMSYYLACQLSDRFAAVASVTGSMTPLQFNTCNPQHPMPILQIHGTNDFTVPYDGANWTKAVEDVVAYWVEHNNCNETPFIRQLPDLNTSDGSYVEEILYKNGDQGVETKLLKLHGAGHTWPGNVFNNSGVNKDINGSLEVWKFLSQYSLDQLTMTTPIDDPLAGKSLLNMYPNPTHSYLKIETDEVRKRDYEILTLTGQVKMRGSLSSSLVLDLSTFSKGVYLLRSDNHVYKILKTE